MRLSDILPNRITMGSFNGEKDQYIIELKPDEVLITTEIEKLYKNSWVINYIDVRNDRTKVGVVERK